MPVADILERAREVGLDVVAITDHDSAAGGLEARDLADRYGVRVISARRSRAARVRSSASSSSGRSPAA